MLYFNVKELCVSGSYPRLVQIPETGSAEYKNIVLLIERLLDPIRARLGKPIRVTSGYRPPALNKAVGGSPTSNHRVGAAADIHTGNDSTDNMLIVKTLLALKIPYDECIIEGAKFSASGEIISAQWVHVAYRHGNNRMKLLWTKDFKTYNKVKVENSFIIKKY